jgi:signal transduction histidine kinase
MKELVYGKFGGVIAFTAICGLVAGGLGWATAAAVRLEGEQLAEHAEAERAERMRLALWRLDSYVAPLIAVEDGRPFNHYSAVFAAPLAYDNRGAPRPPGAVVEPSPLLTADLPDWMLLHFQLDAASGWESPQAPSVNLSRVLQNPPIQTTLANATPERTRLLDELKRCLKPAGLIAAVRDRVSPPTHKDKILLPAKRPSDATNTVRAGAANQGQNNNSDYELRQQANPLNGDIVRPAQSFNRSLAINSVEHNGENWLSFQGMQGVPGAEVLVNLSPMTALWMPTEGGRERLLLVRLVRIEEKEVCQGIVLDDDALRGVLAEKVADLFPDARLSPVHEPEPPQPERTMTALPLQLDPGPTPALLNAGWTPLRVGLSLAWTAALVALLAVGLGGWSLIDLSQRRIRFVSAVTHELRTPLTTLQLYLDMLVNGLVRDEKQRGEYIQTLNAEANRLSRLVGNVLDFSRLENQRPRLNRTRVAGADLLAQIEAVWRGRCSDADKELVIENALNDGAALCTDGELVQQILGNLLDNACKYSRGAADRRVWLRVRRDGRRLVFEVADHGPGVPKRERRSIFRAFRRGRDADVTGGGVGLGLALARRWAGLVGGELTLRPASAATGACFRLVLPGDVR